MTNATETIAAQALEEALQKAGGPAELARKLNITVQAVSQWKKCPTLRVLEVERLTGVSRHDLSPEIYPPDEGRASRVA
jgi:DNA-binding transcriptional regulator YdaS (Cro superfamily)